MLRVIPHDEHDIPMFATQQVGRTLGKIDPITKTAAIEITISVMASRMDRHCNVSSVELLFVLLILKLFLPLNFFLTSFHVSFHFSVESLDTVVGCLGSPTDSNDLDG